MQPEVTAPPPPPPKPSAPAPAPVPVKRRMSFRSLLWVALLLLFAYGIGYIPKELERRRVAETLRTTELDLRLANLHRLLGVASEEAQRNNFANASAAARAFFDGCRSVTRDYPLTDQPRTRLALEAYASSSDTILGQLANADPNVKAQLAALYLTMNGVLARRQ